MDNNLVGSEGKKAGTFVHWTNSENMRFLRDASMICAPEEGLQVQRRWGGIGLFRILVPGNGMV